MEIGLPLIGKKALITGASSGLGMHFARVLAHAGADVCLAARRQNKLDNIAADIKEMGRNVCVAAIDVSDEDSVIKGVDQAWDDLGGIDILVNNAGIAASGAIVDQALIEWDAVLNTNLTGVFLVARETANKMAERGAGGSIINIASILGSGVSKGVAAYAVSKAGVIQFTKAMALETARFGIRVNALAPGYFKTDINSEYLESAAGETMLKAIPQRRFGEKQDLDGPLLLLAGDQSQFMTGTILTIDGGQSLAIAGT